MTPWIFFGIVVLALSLWDGLAVRRYAVRACAAADRAEAAARRRETRDAVLRGNVLSLVGDGDE